MDKHDLCRVGLRFARIDAEYILNKGMAIEVIPKITSSKISDEEYAVFSDHHTFNYKEYSACCAFDARKEFIYDYIDFKEKG